ncbi:MAG: trypsin-like peptidase domain-containing protein [Magnetococcales bacterium]|nr:trypsin-like peptidase domain-containing protein [Magnetococcales bacterium]MBF0156992.1 trypsin-like peptidase domain-containing protein [Magnetococcales bacterium]
MPQRLGPLLLVWVFVLLTLWLGERFIRTFYGSFGTPRAISARGDLAEFERHGIEVFKNLSPSVVYIVTQTQDPRVWFQESARVESGSGFVWDGEGHVVTNFHVVKGADRMLVHFGDGGTMTATLVGGAEDYDLAVLKIVGDPAGLRPIPLGSSHDLLVGQAVFAIGNPFGLTRTLTTGVISALNRRLPTDSNREIRGVIQTDAAINPGNSGGPLLDSAGRLIGVNTAILSRSGSSSGIGFAVPVDVVNQVVPDLLSRGRVARPGIGVMVLPEEFAARLGVRGIVIDQVVKGAAAEAAGIKGMDRAAGRLGDVIIAVDGEQVDTVAELSAHLEAAGIGNEVELTLMRGERRLRVRVRVEDIS